MIHGLSHVTFVVRDLQRMTRFLVDIFEAEEVYASAEQTYSVSPEKFFLVGTVWIAIMEGDPLPQRSYNHVAFKIDDADFDRYARRIRAAGVEIMPGRDRVSGEGRSLYFHDHDNHLFELHTGTLEQRLQRYRQDP